MLERAIWMIALFPAALSSGGCQPCAERAELASENEARRLTALDAALADAALTRVELPLVCFEKGAPPPDPGQIAAAEIPRGYCQNGTPSIAGGYPPAFAKDKQGGIVALRQDAHTTEVDERSACSCPAGKGIPVEYLTISGKLPAGASAGETVSISYSYRYTLLKSPTDCEPVP